MHIAMNAVGLFFDSNLVGLLLLLVDVAAQPELAAKNDGLLDETALFAAAERAATNLLALISNGRIGIETGLTRLFLRPANKSVGLFQRGIIGVGESLKIGERHWSSSRNILEQLRRGQIRSGLMFSILRFLQRHRGVCVWTL